MLAFWRPRSTPRLWAERNRNAAYKKMLGAPFDLSLVRGGPGRGPGGNRFGAANQADASKKAAPNGDIGFVAPPTSSTSTKSGCTLGTAKTKKKSLASQRGLDD